MTTDKTPPQSNPNPPYEGTLFVTRKGVGYITLEGFDADIEIPSDKTGTALHGDTVEINILPKTDDRLQGEVLKVITRARDHFVGTIENVRGTLGLHIDDDRIQHLFLIENPEDLKENYKAYGKVNSWGDTKTSPTIQILEVLGEKGEHETETRALLLSHNIDTAFPKDVEKEAETIRQNHTISLDGRLDMRDRVTCTIDPHNAKDFDDALSVKELESGWYEIGIHIADVSHFVKLGTEIDREARERAFSVYLVDRTIPMLPEALSNDLCSLNPGEDKYAFSAFFEMNIQGDVRARNFAKTVIKSDKRFTYQEAQDVLDKKIDSPYSNELSILETIGQALRKEKNKKGAIDFDSEEIEFELDEQKRPIRIFKKERLETMRLVEEFMLLANREVATFMSKQKGVPTSIYRVHDTPNPEKLESLSVFLHALGYETPAKLKDISPKDVQKLIEMSNNKPEEETIKTAILRSMAKATYTTTNIGHFGLAFDFYTHFTSPIRRYPDLMVHRILHDMLQNKPQKKDVMVKYENILRHATEKEIEAMGAERDSIRMKQVEYMKEHVGEIFTGKITGVTEWGVYIEDVETKSEGMVRIKNLGDDFFTLNEKTYAIEGTRTKKKFSLGDKVQVRLTGVNLDERTIDWTLV